MPVCRLAALRVSGIVTARTHHRLAAQCALAEMTPGVRAYELAAVCVSAETVPESIQNRQSALRASAEIAGAM